jgi:hypothetical protein
MSCDLCGGIHYTEECPILLEARQRQEREEQFERELEKAILETEADSGGEERE